jgi:hypothetical protein
MLRNVAVSPDGAEAAAAGRGHVANHIDRHAPSRAGSRRGKILGLVFVFIFDSFIGRSGATLGLLILRLGQRKPFHFRSQ